MVAGTFNYLPPVRYQLTSCSVVLDLPPLRSSPYRSSCRKLLAEQGRAVVTTCSHIFCIECAERLFKSSRLCPACESQLSEPDDVVICSLNPSNDYRTSVLSGLSPSIIMEICSRALSFWQYQITQEAAYQAMMLHKSQDRGLALEREIAISKGEIQKRRKVRDVLEQSREKEREYGKLKNNYDKLKRRTFLVGSGENVFNDSNIQSVSEQGRLPRTNSFRQQGRTAMESSVEMGLSSSRNIRTPININPSDTSPSFNPKLNNSVGFLPESGPSPHRSTSSGTHPFKTMNDDSDFSRLPASQNKQQQHHQQVVLSHQRRLALRADPARSQFKGRSKTSSVDSGGGNEMGSRRNYSPDRSKPGRMSTLPQ
ncbi:Zinc finger, RING-type, conserved site [Phaffia rhodozyma]|uniref:Zinc finger, RING-type, conserved site n=1 Tax=Phaffia rhodozyma TaxID=264483 RepID=A0A0F7STL6_PHARH|nr:Zinc finger, RING-type, conserved site [Phaffia rhodozyma]